MGLLGYDSITITDITDVNPIRLDLTSSQPIYQTKRAGEKYEPDYTISPLIITPSLYFGTEEVSLEKYKNKIKFYINEEIITNTETIYVENACLYIKDNLIRNTQIKAVINNITDDRTNVEYESISESLSFYLLSYDSSGYTAFIESNNGRYDFSNADSSPITLTARLFLGNVEQDFGVSYLWSRSSGEVLANNTSKNLTIERANIYSHENFICKITYESVSYVTTCAIDDRTDLYTGAIISDTSLVMTPILNTANLTCKIFRNGQEITSGDITYEWLYYTNNSTIGEPIGETKNISISLGSEKNPPKDSFSLYCIATVDSKYKVVSYLPISYSVSYTPILTPKTIFIPANSDGSYKGEETVIKRTLIFFLQGEDGNAIESNLSSFSINGESVSAIQDNYKYSIPISISIENFKSYNESEIFELSYIYKGHSFNEEFYVVKNIQGEVGADGSSYSLMLTNDYHRFAGGEVYAIGEQEVSTNIRFFKGDEELDIKVLKINDKILTTGEQSINSGLTAKINKSLPSKDVQITFKTISKKLKEGGAIAIEATIELGSEEKNFITMFNYDINYEGNSYFLSFKNGTSISYLPSKNSFSPNIINFYAYYRQNGLGENKAYVDGQVFVSVDGSAKTKLTGSGAYYSYEIKNNPKNNITFYLYNSVANNSNPEEIYLMDRETIPILTSLEGAEIGGENLIRFSGTLEQLSDRWSYEYVTNAEIAIKKDNEVNSAIFNFNSGACSITSPSFFIDEEIRDKYLCFSFYFKDNNGIADERINGNNIYFSLLSYNSSDTKIEEKTFSIFDIKIDENKTIERGKWIRFYEIFKIGTSTASYFKIRIGGIINSTNTNKVYKFEVKKPKLELGNTPTAWSKANNDILFEGLNVDFSNLNGSSIVDILNKQIENIKANSDSIISIAGGNISITAPDGNKIFNDLNDFYNYLNNSINEVQDLQTNKYNLIDTQLKSLSGDLSDGIGKLNEIRNAIKLGYDNNNNNKPYMLFIVETPDIKSSMKLTTDRLSFILNGNELAYFGTNSLTIERARVREGFYLGSGNTGYLAIKTTEQGCAFTWENTFTE